MQRWRRNELIGFAAAASMLASATVALGQLPWGHPIFASAVTAPCTLGSHFGQLTTWNSGDKDGSITLSNSDYTAAYTGASSIVSLRASPKSPGRHTGKWYYAAHLDSGGTTGWVFGAANGSMPLGHYPGGQDGNSVGIYSGNWGTQSTPVQDWLGPVGLSVWVVIALDLDANKAWGGIADGSCNIDPTKWSGKNSLDGNPATGFDGIDISGVNDGSSVMPAWGGFATSGVQQVTLYTNTQFFGTLAGYKYWDQP